MAYANQSVIALAGDVSKGNFANSKAVHYLNEGENPLVAGRFVALSPKGVKEVAKADDVLAGVVVRSDVKGDTPKGLGVDVMHIGTADGIWVEVAKGETVARGDKVYVLAATAGDKKAGQIVKTKTGAIETKFHVINVAEGIAEITLL